MGCFLACFGSFNGKRHKPEKKTLQRDRSHWNYESLQPISPLKQTAKETVADPLPESREKPEKESLNGRKKVTFDLNVETYENISTQEVPNYELEINEERERGSEEKRTRNDNKLLSVSENNSTTLSNSTGSRPSNHRYQNCINSSDEVEEEEEEEEVEYEDRDFEDDDSPGEEEYFDSYFSRTLLAAKETDVSGPFSGSPPHRKSELLVKGNVRDRSQYVNSVLNPVENLTQWKAVKEKIAAPIKHHHWKENIGLERELNPPFSPESTFKLPVPQIPLDTNLSFNLPKSPNQEISVNGSLSSWLVPSETTPPTKTSKS